MTAINNGAAPGAPATVDVSAVVSRLRRTFEAGETRPLAWRREQLAGLLRMLTECESQFAAAVEQDLGRGAMGTFMGDVAPVTAEIRHTLAELKSWAAPQRVRVPVGQQPGKARVVPTPKGVVLVIGAWNFPVLLTLQPAVSAIAAGNAVVIKPSELAPATAGLLADLLPRYVEPGAVSVVNGDAAVSTALLAEKFDHVFFTGSTRVGRIVLEACAKNLTPTTLELGGKSPVIIAADADLDIAARRIAWAKLVNAGQACIAPDYVLVDDAVRPAFVEKLLEYMSRAGAAESTRIVSEAHFDRLERLLDGHESVIASGERDRATRRFGPVVVPDPDPDSALMQEEIFGPILPVLSVPDLGSAIRFVDERPDPLALYVFTQSDATAQRVLENTNSGSCCVNHLLYQLLVPDLPFGGIGPSGIGAYHGKYGFDTFSHQRAVLHKSTAIDPSIAYPPYGPAAEKLMRRVMG